MPERRGSRFVVEALFLAALTVALALAHLDALEIVGAMALGWLVVAALEWTAWRGEPHYGAGLPPRYYLPRVDLPPPQPLEQVEQGYPGSVRATTRRRGSRPPSLRAEVLGEWPLFGPVAGEETEERGRSRIFADTGRPGCRSVDGGRAARPARGARSARRAAARRRRPSRRGARRTAPLQPSTRSRAPRPARRFGRRGWRTQACSRSRRSRAANAGCPGPLGA